MPLGRSSPRRPTPSSGRFDGASPFEEVESLFRKRRIACKQIIRVLSAADSGYGCDAVLYINGIGKARTAVLRYETDPKRVEIQIVPDWSVP